jgi:hypothetical protein
VSEGKELILLEGTLPYDSGYGDWSVLYFCYGYNGENNEWKSCGGLNNSFDLNHISRRRLANEHGDPPALKPP